MMNGMDPGTKVEFCVDSLLPVRTLQVTSAKINENGRLEVCIEGETIEYPDIYLKLNCQCKKCFNPDCLAYTNQYCDSSAEGSKLLSVDTLQNGEIVKCVHADGHESEFRCDWLYNRRMTEEGKKEREKHLTMYNPIPWPQASEMVIQRVTYQQVTETTEGLETLGDAIATQGICLITDAPDRLVSKEFSEKTGLFRTKNQYGEAYHVKPVPKAISHAFSTHALGFHTDQAYLISTPSIQFQHCVAQSKTGGESIMADSIRAANILREKNPDYYRILSTTNMNYVDIVSRTGQPQYFVSNTATVLNLDVKGNPSFVQWNSASRSGFFDGTAEEYELHAKALRSFWEILKENSIELKMKAGDILVFDNKRVLHGRKAFEACSSQARELEVWYVNWDWLLSKLRISKIKGAKSKQQ